MLRVSHRLIKTTGNYSHMEIVLFPIMCVCRTSLEKQKFVKQKRVAHEEQDIAREVFELYAFILTLSFIKSQNLTPLVREQITTEEKT